MHPSKQSRNQPGQNRFATTRWSVVLAAANEKSPTQASEALSALCGTYWYPLYAYVRKQGYGEDDAQDLTQEFFLRLMETDSLQRVDRVHGRFRSYLLGAMKHFLSDQWDHARAQKRGGGKSPASIDLRDAEGRFAIEPSKGLTPEQIYDRRWTLTVLDNVLSRLELEYMKSDKACLFSRLKGFLAAGDSSDSFAKAASELGMTEGAVKVAAHRMRRRYGDLLRTEIAETVENADEVEDEIRQLFAALC